MLESPPQKKRQLVQDEDLKRKRSTLDLKSSKIQEETYEEEEEIAINKTERGNSTGSNSN